MLPAICSSQVHPPSTLDTESGRNGAKASDSGDKKPLSTCSHSPRWMSEQLLGPTMQPTPDRAPLDPTCKGTHRDIQKPRVPTCATPQSTTNALYLYKLTHAFRLDLMEHSGES